MNCKIRDAICWIVLPIMAVISEETIPLHKFREPGDSLDISIQQELNRSTSIALEWIEKKQSDNGSFGSKASPEGTALSITALNSVDNHPYSNQVAAALDWLKRNCNTPAATNIHSTAWCYAAFITSPGEAAPTDYTSEARNRLLNAIRKEGPYRELCIEILNSTTLNCVVQPEEQLEFIKDSFNSAEHTPLQMWINARIINRWAAGRLIDSDGKRVDWRRIYARKLISSQRIDPEGGGFWSGSDSDKIICNTALAILTAKEL